MKILAIFLLFLVIASFGTGLWNTFHQLGRVHVMIGISICAFLCFYPNLLVYCQQTFTNLFYWYKSKTSLKARIRQIELELVIIDDMKDVPGIPFLLGGPLAESEFLLRVRKLQAGSHASFHRRRGDSLRIIFARLFRGRGKARNANPGKHHIFREGAD